MDVMAARMSILPLPPEQAGGPGSRAASRPMALSALLHMAALVPLLAAIALIGPQALAALPPVLLACACLAYGRLAAFFSGKRGAGEASWMAECLPFAAYACLQGTSLDVGSCLVLLASTAAMAAGLVSLEGLLFPRYRGFALALGYCAVLAGLALSLAWTITADSSDPGRQLAIPAIAGTSGLLLAFITRYAATRRRR